MDSFTLSAEELKKSLLELQDKNEQGILHYEAGIDKLKTDLQTNGQKEIDLVITMTVHCFQPQMSINKIKAIQAYFLSLLVTERFKGR